MLFTATYLPCSDDNSNTQSVQHAFEASAVTGLSIYPELKTKAKGVQLPSSSAPFTHSVMIRQSQNLSLWLKFSQVQFNSQVQALWEELQDSAVEPMRTPVPCLTTFAEGCLFWAIVMKNNKKMKKNKSNYVYQKEKEKVVARNADLGSPRFLGGVAEQGDDDDDETPIGLVYFTADPGQSAAREGNIGIIIAEAYRRRGFAREAVELVLGWAFEELKFHRIQAAVMDSALKDRAMRVFVGQGFTHEGTRRRSVLKWEYGGVVGGGGGGGGVWKDVTYLAMLDTEWTLREVLRNKGPAPTLWDEMFARHAREREEMLRWDERHNRIRKVSSTKTLRIRVQPDCEFDAESCCESSYDPVLPLLSPSPSLLLLPSPLSSPSTSTSPTPSDTDISEDMLDYLDFGFGENLGEGTDDVSRRSSPSPYGTSGQRTWSDATDSVNDHGSDWDIISEREQASGSA